MVVHSVTHCLARCISLLAYVLLHRPGRVYRERAAATLWPDVADAEARARVRRQMYLITQCIPQARSQAWFVADARSLGWNPNVPVRVDVERLRESVRATDWATAVKLYGGDLLAELDDEWLGDERDRLREQHLVDLERLALAQLANGSYATALVAARELLRLDPWREAATRLAMDLRFASGDRAGALAEYERFAKRLRDDLDVEPMAETMAVYTSIVNGVRETPVRFERR